MRKLLLLGLGTVVTGCGYISEAKLEHRLDPDQDGVSWLNDCDDNDAGLGLPTTWYVDADADGFGSEDETVEACTVPEGAVARSGDCDDSNADINPAADDALYDGIDSNCDDSNDCDADGDGYDGSADGGLPTEACPAATDCDDGDPNIFPDPSISELFFNGVDDDCNLETGDGDADGDGFWHQDYVAIAAERGFEPLTIPAGQEGDCYDALDILVDSFNATVLNGFPAISPADVNPDAADVFYDGVDQNCDSLDDFDKDLDGFSSSEWQNRTGAYGDDCVDSTDSENYQDFGVSPEEINSEATDTWYDGVDQNCQGDNDFDQDKDNYDIATIDCDGSEETNCDFDGDGVDDFIGGGDCDDEVPDISPEAEEGIADGIDQNCDGLELCFEDGDEDGSGSNVEAYSPDLTCLADGFSNFSNDCDDGDGDVYPGAIELPIDGVDQDCDSGDLCYTDADNDGFGSTSTVSSSDMDCDDTGEASNTDDCDDGNPTIGILVWYFDNDGDAFGDLAAPVQDCTQPPNHVTDNTDCDDAESTVYPNAPELCDGIDNTCIGFVLPDESDIDGDGYVECSSWVGSSSIIISGGDCDDEDGAVYPNALELCDGQYNDCSDLNYNANSAPLDEIDNDFDNFVECPSWVGDNTVIGGDDCDDVDPFTYPYAGYQEINSFECMTDFDGDGFGTETPFGFALPGTDCDDYDFNIYPDAPEEPDPFDNNCDGMETMGVSYENCFSAEVEGRYFLFCENALNWIEADDVCLLAGYNGLASIESEVQNIGISAAQWGLPGPLWIGYHDLNTTDTFEWSNGSTSTYVNWDINEPGNTGFDDCVILNTNLTSVGYLWEDTSCVTSHNFICSY